MKIYTPLTVVLGVAVVRSLCIFLFIYLRKAKLSDWMELILVRKVKCLLMHAKSCNTAALTQTLNLTLFQSSINLTFQLQWSCNCQPMFNFGGGRGLFKFYTERSPPPKKKKKTFTPSYTILTEKVTFFRVHIPSIEDGNPFIYLQK